MSREIKSYNVNDMQYKIIAISVQGDKEKNNQDYFKIYCDSDNLIVSVTDGLGSARMSEYGSRYACEECENLLKNSEKFNFDKFFANWNARIEGNILDYDSTLKFIKIDNSSIYLWKIGDGWTALFKEGELIELENKENFLNRTDSILSVGANQSWKDMTCEKCDNFICVLATDGFSEDIIKNNSKEFLCEVKNEMDNNFEKFAYDLENFMINWPLKTNLDDKTVVFIRGAKI